MKRINISGIPAFALLLSVIFTSCVSSQNFFPIRGTGPLVDKNIRVSDFHGIDVSGGFDVTLIQGTNEGLVLTAQENLFEHISAEVEQGVLKIYTDKNIIESKGMKVQISFKNIDKLSVSGGGDVKGETTIDVPTLAVNLSGGGDINTVVNISDLKCTISGGGDAKIDGTIKNYGIVISGGGDLKSEVASNYLNCTMSGGGDFYIKGKGKGNEAKISLSGGGDMTLDIITDNISCGVSGGGNASLTGEAINLDVSLNGGGDLNAGGMVTDKTTFHANGGSDIHVNATREIVGHISGGGDVYYSGNPPVVDIDAKGGSEVHKQ